MLMTMVDHAFMFFVTIQGLVQTFLISIFSVDIKL